MDLKQYQESLTPQQENIYKELDEKAVYYYFDGNLNPIKKTKEIFKNEDKIIIYPYSVNKKTDKISKKKIKTIEFIGWRKLDELPRDFKKKYRNGNIYFGIKSKRLKQFFNVIYRRVPNIERLVVYRTNGKNRFYKKKVHLNWVDVESILKEISRYTANYHNDIKIYVNNQLSKFSKKFTFVDRVPKKGEIKVFFEKFTDLRNISSDDTSAFLNVFTLLSDNSKILITNNFINIKEKINIAYFEKIINQFQSLMKSLKDNEEEWQKFFEHNSWILSYLFPYNVFIYKEKAYVGGKTIENKEGKIVDFLLQNDFKDNYALLEIKTHKKKLLKNKSYRGEDVYPITKELAGAIAQCLDQKDNFIKEWGKRISPEPLSPKVVLVIGKRKSLTKDQIKSFELFRNNLKDIDIVTFDELYGKIEGLYHVLSKRME